MRLPFMQLAQEVIEQAAPDLAVMLDWTEEGAGWGMVKLFRWALGRCPDHEPPSANATVTGPTAAKLLAKAAGYQGDPEAFVTACEQVRPGVLERVEGGIRVRGLDRYDAAWKKNNPGKAMEWRNRNGPEPESALPRAGTGPKPGENRTEPDRQKEKETETQTEPPSEVVKKPPPHPSGLVSTPIAPTKPPEQWNALDFWAWAQDRRVAGGFLPEKLPKRLEKLNGWFSMALMTPGVTIHALREGFYRFGSDKHWGSTDPPYPFSAFMTQWTDFTRPEVSSGAAA